MWKWILRRLAWFADLRKRDGMFDWSKAVHPMDAYRGYRPVVSDGFHARATEFHYGCDIMYRRQSNGKPELPEFTRGFFCPSGKVHARSILDGTVSRVGPDRAGRIRVVVDHHDLIGRPMATFYTHLARPLVAEGDYVTAGQPVGVVGHTGTDINHLHFEIWLTDLGSGRPQWAVNPEPFLAYMQVWDRSDDSEAGGGTLPPAKSGSPPPPRNAAGNGGAIPGGNTARTIATAGDGAGDDVGTTGNEDIKDSEANVAGALGAEHAIPGGVF